MFQSEAVVPHQDNVSNQTRVSISQQKALSQPHSLMDALQLFESDVEHVYREGREILATYWMRNERTLMQNKQKLQSVNA